MGKDTSIIVNKFNSNSGFARFIRTNTFDSSMSKTILTLLRKGTLYFNDDGHVQTKDEKKFFMNPLVPSKSSSTNLIETNLVKSISTKQKFFPSRPLGKYLLYTKSQTKPKFSLLYNPVPRSDYCSFYKNKNTYEEARNLVAQYCLENTVDPACSCINIENTEGTGEEKKYQFCMNDILGGNEIRKKVKNDETQTYGTFQAQCKCLNHKCSTSHPIREIEILRSGACATENNITLCNAVINAEGATFNSNFELKQNCSSKTGITETQTDVGDGGTTSDPVATGSTAATAVEEVDNDQIIAWIIVILVIFFLAYMFKR
jgi:hypothetical protein